MFGSYLKVGGSGGGKPGQRYSREQSKATASTKCQKCLQMGHFTADCKGQRQYAVRPTRTQILKNPKLATKLTASLPPTLEPKEGTAAAILAANEAKRAKLAAEAAAKSSSKSKRVAHRQAVAGVGVGVEASQTVEVIALAQDPSRRNAPVVVGLPPALDQESIEVTRRKEEESKVGIGG
ncbi:uncharacterized protein JCM6883_000198 [Sporobolomyces salmoneus]|uniref:uncharacterized protein n=1 Tax=Sporobolomyces salmoneus TaxID=183962 RepID=UPI003175E9E1